MKKTLAAATIAAALAAGGVAGASIPRADGTIVACYVIDGTNANPSGSVRVVDGRRECTRNERVLTWHQAGPIGPAGPAGADGAPGPAGPAGASSARSVVLTVPLRGSATVGTVGGVPIAVRCLPNDPITRLPHQVLLDLGDGATPFFAHLDGVVGPVGVADEFRSTAATVSMARHLDGLVHAEGRTAARLELMTWSDIEACHLDGLVTEAS